MSGLLKLLNENFKSLFDPDEFIAMNIRNYECQDIIKNNSYFLSEFKVIDCEFGYITDI